MDFTIVDTPGFGDSDGEDAANVEEMVTILHENIQSTNAIVLLLKGDTNRFGEGLVNMVREMTQLFGEDMWNYAVIGVSFWAYDQDSIDDRIETCSDPDFPEDCHDEEWFVKEMNRQLHEKTLLKRNLSAVFIDSFSQYKDNVLDHIQQFYFEQETTKLFDLIDTEKEFHFRTISDILLENEELTKENKWLNDVIEKNITELQTNMFEIEDDLEDIRITSFQNTNLIAKDEKNIQTNTNNIQDNSNSIGTNSNKIDGNSDSIIENMDNIEETNGKTAHNANLILSLSTRLEELETKLTQEISDREEQVSGINLAPLGSIIAWVLSVPDGRSNALPAGWVECDGRAITEGIWMGRNTPDLNTNGYFLKGAPPADNNKFEESMVQDLQIFDYFQGLDHVGCHGAGESTGSDQSVTTASGGKDDPFCQSSRFLSSMGNGIKVGEETRPKNMKVTYIIKIK